MLEMAEELAALGELEQLMGVEVAALADMLVMVEKVELLRIHGADQTVQLMALAEEGLAEERQRVQELEVEAALVFWGRDQTELPQL